MAAILNFSFQKNPLRITALLRPDIIMGCYPCKIKRETNFYQQKQGYPHNYRTTLILQSKNKKNTLCTRVYSGSATGRHLLPQKNPLSKTALHRSRYYDGMLSMHNQKRNKRLSAKTRLPS